MLYLGDAAAMSGSSKHVAKELRQVDHPVSAVKSRKKRRKKVLVLLFIAVVVLHWLKFAGYD